MAGGSGPSVASGAAGNTGTLGALSRHLRAPRRWRGGPAWLVMIADQDAASILTALASGASFRYDLVAFLAILTVPLFFVQEAAGRVGVVTGKGLGTLTREHFRPGLVSTMALSMAVGDIALYVAEYTGIALGLSLFGIPPILSVPVAFAVYMALVLRGPYAGVERVLIGVSAVVLLSLAVLVLHVGLHPYSPLGVSAQPSFFLVLAANAGAVVMPFMLFFQSSATARKPSTVSISRQSTLVGSAVSEALMILVVVVGAGIGVSIGFGSRSEFTTSVSAALGPFGAYALGVGLVAAAFLALVVVSLGSAWGVTEALRLPPKATRWVYLAESLPGLIVPLLFPQLVTIVLALMVAMVFILIVPGAFLGRLVTDRRVMGEHASRGAWRVAFWASLAFVVSVGVVGVALNL